MDPSKLRMREARTLNGFLCRPHKFDTRPASSGYYPQAVRELFPGGPMKRLWFVGLLGALISSAASVSGAESPKYGGRLVFGIAKDIVSLNPFYRNQSTDSFVRELMFQTFL